MAVVGEARIIVRADTTGIKEQIRRGFNGVERDATEAGKKVSKSFGDGFGKNNNYINKFNKDSENLARNFHRAIRNSYKWQAATGALIQSIAALGNGLLALAGNIGGAVAAGGALIGLMAQMRITSLVAKQAFHGIMQAIKASNSGSKKSIKELREEMQQLAFDAEAAALSEKEAAIALEKAREELARAQSLPPDTMARREAELAYQKAELAYRRAKDKNKDLQDELNNPKKKSGSGTDPYKDLTETQKKFALYLKSVMPKMKELREAAASSFLPALTEQMKVMFSNGYFDMLVRGFGNVSKGLAQATRSFTGTLFDPYNKNNMADFFKSASRSTGTMGKVLGNAFGGFLTLMKALDPLIARFTNFLNSKANKFADNMKNNFGPITQFFKDAGIAASGWGAIIGRIFEKFKNLIKANIGPGTGGQLLLDFFNKGSVGFKGLEGAAGEFARKEYFLAAAKNLKAMFESVGKIFSVLQGLAASPQIALFWETLAGVSTPLEEILTAVSGSSVAFAELVVAVTEVAASFADTGQLQAYMDILTTAAQILSSTVNALKPVIQWFGKYIGALGAVITIMIVFKKITMLMWGSIMIFRGAIIGTVAAIKIYKAIVWAGVIAKEAMRLSTLKNTAAARLEQAAMFKNMLTMRLNSIAIGGTALAQTALGKAMLASIPSITAMGASLWTALSPMLPIILAIAAAIAVVAGIAIVMNHINTENSKKAVKSLDKAFKDNRSSMLGATQAQSEWTASLLSVADSAKSGITNVTALGEALDVESKSSDKTTYNALTTSLNVYSKSLAKVAKKSLPEAQRELRNFVVTSGLSRAQTEQNILSNTEYTDALEKQANAMGDTIKMADGSINKQKAMDYALGEGTYLARKARLERDKLNQTLKDSYNSFIDLEGPLQQNIDDLKKYGDTVYDATKKTGFSLTKYVKDLKTQTADANDWMRRINVLAGSLSGEVYSKLVAMGKDGLGLVKSLTTTKNGIAEVNAEAVNTYIKSQAAMQEAQDKAKLYAAGITNGDVLIKLLRANKKFQEAYGADSGLLLSRYVEKDNIAGLARLANEYGVTIDEIVNEQKRVGKGSDLASKVNIQAAWDTNTLATLRADLLKNVGGITLYAKASTVGNVNGGSSNNSNFDGSSVKPWTGGLIWNNSLIRGFAEGGKVYGPGGPVSDRVPAMLSNGEFVVNSASTAKNLALLNMINSSKQAASTASPQNNINMTINAAPGMNEQDVANLVSARLQYELQTGFTL